MHVKIDIDDMIKYSSVYDLKELSEKLADAYRIDRLRVERNNKLENENKLDFIKRMRLENPDWTLAECKRVADLMGESS